MKTIYLGVDPGYSGAIVALDELGDVTMLEKMPREPEPLGVLVTTIINRRAKVIACMERVGPFPGQGVVSVFTFGENVGRLRLALAMMHARVTEIAPVRWQAIMSCRTGGDKNVSKDRAIELFPDVRPVTHALADAMLLAECCRRLHGLGPRRSTKE